MSEDPAPYALGLQLHRALASALLENLKGTPSADMLQCTRSFLRDQHVAADTDKDRKALRRILKLYVDALQSALEDGTASGAVLAEVGAFLHRSGALENLNGRVEALRALRDFTALELPFA